MTDRKFTLYLCALVGMLIFAAYLGIVHAENRMYQRRYVRENKRAELAETALHATILDRDQYFELSESQAHKIKYLEYRRRAVEIGYPRYSEILDAVWNIAPKYNLDPFLVLAVIRAESAFNPTAISVAQCVGLMQINPAVWPIDPDHHFTVRENIEWGCRILREYLDIENGDIARALLRYNGGLQSYPGMVLGTGYLEDR